MLEPRSWPDVEVLVRRYLAEQLEDADVTVGIGVPPTWDEDSPDHLQVALDGVFKIESIVVAHASIRLVGRSHSTTRAKALASLGQTLLVAHRGSGGADGEIVVARPLTGVLPARDPETKAELAATTTRVSFRSMPFEPLGS